MTTPKTMTSFGARTRTAMALCAGAALLSLAGCGSEGGSTDGWPQETPAEQTDDENSSDGGDAAEGGGGSVAEEGAGDGDDAGASGGRTRIILVTELGGDETSGDGAPTIDKKELATMLGAPFEATAECPEGLILEPGRTTAGCMGPTSIDRTDPTQEWTASVVMVPAEEGFEDGSRVAVLFSTGTALPEGAGALQDPEVSVTGVGFGSMFGAEPLSADELAESTLQTLTSEQAYVPVDEMAQWAGVTCEDGMDFSQFATVDCEATTADGDSWSLVVAPGTFANNDQGLLVGISVPRNG